MTDDSATSIYSDLPLLSIEGGAEERRSRCASSEPEAAQAEASDYHVVETLGSGNFGTTQLAFQKSCPMLWVVLKSPRGPGPGVGMLRREAVILRSLSHPLIVPFRDFVDVSGRLPLLVMEFAAGGSLAERIRRGPAMATGDLCRIFYHLLQALDYVHSKGIIHLDVK